VLRGWYADQTGSAADPTVWRFPLADPGPRRMLDRAVYVRGAMTVLALGERIGRPALHRVLRTWLARHRGRSASTADFERLAGEVSGVDLAGFFRAWLHTSAPPARTADNGL
jgi:aminopeptidase N